MITARQVYKLDWNTIYSQVSQIPWIPIFTGAGIIFVVLTAWILVESRLDPLRGTIDKPDAGAFVKGNCGDAMEISLRFSGDRVTEAKYWTDGCRMSRACGAAAAELALNRTPEELADIDHAAIERKIGHLPEEDLHCATLAAGALQESLKVYMTKRK